MKSPPSAKPPRAWAFLPLHSALAGSRPTPLKNPLTAARVAHYFLSSRSHQGKFAQIPAPETTSKVKRVLLYSKNGGWNGNQGPRKETIRVFLKMAQTKGFVLDTSDRVSDLNPENPNHYQVIVWNNNIDGAASVPDSSARNAVVEYVKKGEAGFWSIPQMIMPALGLL